MKDSEFIALLNLYLDHEISAADAARLEAEVQTNHERRQIYEQYCRMQKACKVLAADFVAEEESAAADKKVVAFDVGAAEAHAQRRKRMGNFYTIGTFAAAAACVAIVFIGRGQRQAEDEAIASMDAPAPVVASAEIQSGEQVKAVLVAATPVSSGPRALGGAAQANATLVADPLSLTGKAQADALMAAMEQSKSQFAWIEAMQLPPVLQPVPLSELRFETTPAALRIENRSLGNRAPVNNVNVEMAAFQFQK